MPGIPRSRQTRPRLIFYHTGQAAADPLSALPPLLLQATGRLRKNVSYFKVNYGIVGVSTTALVMFMVRAAGGGSRAQEVSSGGSEQGRKAAAAAAWLAGGFAAAFLVGQLLGAPGPFAAHDFCMISLLLRALQNPWSLIVLAVLALLWGYAYIVRTSPIVLGGRKLRCATGGSSAGGSSKGARLL